jgi:hypothetical protein
VHAVWDAVYQRVARWRAGPWLGLALAWAIVVVLANWQPFDFTSDPARFEDSDPSLSDEDTPLFGWRRMSWAPLVDYYWGSRYQALDQFLWRSVSFAPLGMVLAMAFGRRQHLGLVLTLVSATLVAALVEFGQYFIPERHPSVTDLLIEVLGAWIGYFLTRHIAHALEDSSESREQTAAFSTGYAEPEPAPIPVRPSRRRRPVPSPVFAIEPRRGVLYRLNAFFDYLAAKPFWVGVVCLAVVGVFLMLGFVLVLRVIL